MNQRSRWMVSLWSLCLIVWALPVWADTMGGTLVSVDSVGGKLVIKDKIKLTNRTFNVAKIV